MYDEYYIKPTINDADKILRNLAKIEYPESTDNYDEPFNSEYVYPHLSPEQKDIVDNAVKTLYNYTRNPDGTPNRRSITTLNDHGYKASLDVDQYDANILVGRIMIDKERFINISDSSTENDDD
jgi:hypothetical protein